MPPRQAKRPRTEDAAPPVELRTLLPYIPRADLEAIVLRAAERDTTLASDITSAGEPYHKADEAKRKKEAKKIVKFDKHVNKANKLLNSPTLHMRSSPMSVYRQFGPMYADIRTNVTPHSSLGTKRNALDALILICGGLANPEFDFGNEVLDLIETDEMDTLKYILDQFSEEDWEQIGRKDWAERLGSLGGSFAGDQFQPELGVQRRRVGGQQVGLR